MCFADEMVSNVNMLFALMESCRRGERDSAGIVKKSFDWDLRGE